MEKLQIHTTSWLQFKPGLEPVQTACNNNDASGTGNTNERTANWWSKTIRSGDQSAEVDNCSNRPSNVYIGLLRALVNIYPLRTVRQLAA